VKLQEEIISIVGSLLIFAIHSILQNTNMEPDNLLGIAIKLWAG
jgi:hypothetical protein